MFPERSSCRKERTTTHSSIAKARGNFSLLERMATKEEFGYGQNGQASIQGSQQQQTHHQPQQQQQQQQQFIGEPQDMISDLSDSMSKSSSSTKKRARKFKNKVPNPHKVDHKAKLERSRQSARECRARKKLRYQYLEDLVTKRENANLALKREIDQLKDVASLLTNGRCSRIEIERKLGEI